MADEPAHYRQPGWFMRHVVNPGVALLTRAGISVWGSRVLTVRGRRSGLPHSVPVNLLEHDGHRYLVSPRGHTEWVRNLRATGEGELRVGRRVERFRAAELADTEKPEVLRAYLGRWKMEVGAFFGGVDEHSSEQQLMVVAPDHPVFEVEPAGS